MVNVEVTLANYEEVYGLETLADDENTVSMDLEANERKTSRHFDTIDEFGTGESYYTK